MKTFIVPFMVMAMFMVTDANAQCSGGGTGFGFSSGGYDCNYASSLWSGFCNGGPAMPASAAGGGCGGGCGGCGGSGGGLLSGLFNRGGGSSCGGGCGGGSGYSYGGYGIQGFGAYANTMPSYGASGQSDMWWYGSGSAGRPARCASGGCGGGHSCGGSSCGVSSRGGGGCSLRSRLHGLVGRRHCGGGHQGIFSAFRNRMSYSSWIGGGPLDSYSLVAGYGGFVGSQMDYGCINGACGGSIPGAPAGDCGCNGGGGGAAVEYGTAAGQEYGGEVTQSYGGESYEGQSYEGTVEEYAPVENAPIEEGPFYESSNLGPPAVEGVPAGTAADGSGTK